MKHTVPSAPAFCRESKIYFCCSQILFLATRRCACTLRSRWKPKRCLIHSRLRLAVIAVVWLVGRVCVALIVALERRGNRETEWGLGCFINHECQGVPLVLCLNKSIHAPVMSWARVQFISECKQGLRIYTPLQKKKQLNTATWQQRQVSEVKIISHSAKWPFLYPIEQLVTLNNKGPLTEATKCIIRH